MKKKCEICVYVHESIHYIFVTIDELLCDYRLGTQMEQTTDHITKKRLFLTQLKKSLLRQFYTAITESMLTSSITVWYGSMDRHTRKKTAAYSQ